MPAATRGKLPRDGAKAAAKPFAYRLLKASTSVVVWNDATAVFTFRRAMG